MNIRELIKRLEGYPPEQEIRVSVNAPSGMHEVPLDAMDYPPGTSEEVFLLCEIDD